jgi:multiple sugar transport system substrate-binding protein
MVKRVTWAVAIVVAMSLAVRGMVVPANAADTTIIKFWTFLDPKKSGPREKAWAGIIESFEKQHPDIKVQTEVFPWKDIAQKLIVSAAAGRGPDVTLVEVNLREKLVRGKTLEPLDSYLKGQDFGQEFLSDFYHPDSRVYDGKTYALNLWTNGSAIFYRTDLFEKAGLSPPKTLDEFSAVAKALTKDIDGDGKIDQWGFAEGIARSQPFAHRFLFPLIWAQGGTIVGPKGEATFNGPAGVKAVQFFVDLVKTYKAMPPDVVNLTYDEKLQGFMAGKYAMIVEGMHRYEQTQTSQVTKGKVGLAPIPSWDSNIPAPTSVLGWDIGIGATSKVKDAAWSFVAYTMSHEAQLMNAQVGGQVPALRSVASDPFFQSENAKELKFTLDYVGKASKEFPETKNFDRLIELFNLSLQECLLKGVPVQQALDEAAAKYND